MQFQLLFTAFALLASCIATWMAWSARDAAARAAHSEHRLSIMRGQVKGLEVAVTALDEQHKRLAGQFHVSKRKDRQNGPLDLASIEPVNPDDVCPNWAAAQREGPGSAPSMCACEYCESRREDRRRRRATLPVGVKS